MILVADSGSTKCDWILIDSQSNQHKTNSMGFNPFFHDADLVYSKLMENELFIEYRNLLIFPKKFFFFNKTLNL